MESRRRFLPLHIHEYIVTSIFLQYVHRVNRNLYSSMQISANLSSMCCISPCSKSMLYLSSCPSTLTRSTGLDSRLMAKCTGFFSASWSMMRIGTGLWVLHSYGHSALRNNFVMTVKQALHINLFSRFGLTKVILYVLVGCVIQNHTGIVRRTEISLSL